MVLSLRFIATSRMLDPRRLDPVAAPKPRSQGDIHQTACDQLRHAARERAGLLFDIHHPQRAFALRLLRQPLAEPSVDDFEALHRVARGRIPAIESVEYKEFIGWPPGACDDVDGRHAAPRMGCEDEAVHRECHSAHRLSKALQAILRQLLHAAREQGRKIVPRITAVRLSEKETRENPLVSVASGEKWTVST